MDMSCYSLFVIITHFIHNSGIKNNTLFAEEPL